MAPIVITLKTTVAVSVVNSPASMNATALPSFLRLLTNFRNKKNDTTAAMTPNAIVPN